MASNGRLTLIARRVLPALAAIALLAAALLLANDAAGGNDRLSAWYPWVLTASLLALVALVGRDRAAPVALAARVELARARRAAHAARARHAHLSRDAARARRVWIRVEFSRRYHRHLVQRAHGKRHGRRAGNRPRLSRRALADGAGSMRRTWRPTSQRHPTTACSRSSTRSSIRTVRCR